MTKLGKKNQKRLAKLVAVALMCAGGLCSLPSVASAEEVKEVTWDGSVTGSTPTNVTPANAMEIDGPSSYVIYAHITNTYVTQGYKTVTLNSGGTTLIVTPGYNRTTTAALSGFTLNVNGGNWSSVYGAYLPKGGDVTGNKVYIKGGTVGGEVFGGSADISGNVRDNEVHIEDGNVNHNIIGGYSINGNSEHNTVTINGGTIDYPSGYGSQIYGGRSNRGDAENNTVTISGGAINPNPASSLKIYGGFTNGNGKKAKGNDVTIGGNASFADTGNLDVYGGYAYSSDSSDTEASGNTVTIEKDATLGSNTRIFGGYATKKIYDSGLKDVPSITNNNTVNILKAITVKQIVGGSNLTEGTGNTLNIAAKGVIVGEYGVAGFQNMNFYLPSDIANNDTMLTVNGSEATDVKGVTFGVAALSGVKLVKGDTVNLITNPNGLATDDTLKTTDSASLAKAKFLSANSLTTDDAYELSISKKDANTIIATVDNVTEQKADEGGSNENGGSGKKAVSIPDVLKSPVETRAGVVTLVNAGADLLVSQGMSNAADAAAAERTEGDAAAAPRAGGFAPFAAVSFGKLRAQSGSHVDNKGIGMNLGFAREIANKSGKLLVGPVIEYGHGSYDSYQDSGIKADGKSSYWGIGVIAKQTNDNGFYYEGSLRAGRTKSDYNSDLRPGLHVNYDSSATYWAAHLGVGKLVDIGHDNTLDYYGKYFYSHTGSDSTYLNGANETANFDAVNSHRIRLGARLTHALNEKNKIYGGLAWQYEFKGDARATYSVSGEAPSPSVKGSSGMIELGWQVKPGKSPMTIDLGVTGWVGKQRGITANVQANWTF